MPCTFFLTWIVTITVNWHWPVVCHPFHADARLTGGQRPFPTDVKEMISAMGHLFVTEGLANPTVTAIDSTLLKAKGRVWHKSSMKKGVVPRSGIDNEARWGYSHTKGWVFGYKLHLTSTTGNLVGPFDSSRCDHCQCHRIARCSFL